MSEPLSKRVAQLSVLALERPLNLYDVEDVLQDKGAAAVICILCLPFLFPIPIPGISTIFGFAIVLLTLKIMLGNNAKLPRRIGETKLPSALFQSIATKSLKFILWIEKWVRPRAEFLTQGPWKIVAGVSLISASIALALPIPPVIPLTNTIPALGIFLVSLGMMEEDGFMVIVGHITGLIAWVYLFAVGGAAWAIFDKIFKAVFQ